jgi:dihydrofolate reductase
MHGGERMLVASARGREPGRSHWNPPHLPLLARLTRNGIAMSGNSPLNFARGGRLNRKCRQKENQMAKIVISGPQNVSLDGVVQDPDGQEGFRLGGWFIQFGGADLEEWNTVARDEALRAEAWLLGRRSYEFFGARWRPRSGELADRLNSMPKYVVSSTLGNPEWNNTTVLKGDVVTEVSKLKQELEGEIVVPASYQLGRTLIEHDLADELRLVVFPVVLGDGERFFAEISNPKPMRLVATKTIGSGLAFLTYQFVREA